LLGRCDIRPVSVKNLKSQGQAFSACYKADADLWTIRTVVSTVTPLGLGIAFNGSFEVCRGYIIEQKVKGATEHLTVTLLQMKTQGILVGKECIQSAIEPIIVNLVSGNPQNIVQGGFAIPELG